MADAKHTPGPWEFLEDGRTEEEFNRGKALTIGGPRPNNDDLAQVFSRDDATVSVSRDEAAANARLIAAAPDGYALALFVQEMLVAQADVGGTLSPTEARALELANAMIAKATGAA